VLLKTIRTEEFTYEWFKNDWIHLVSLDPITAELHVFENEQFVPYSTSTTSLPIAESMEELVEKHTENIPVHLLAHQHGN